MGSRRTSGGTKHLIFKKLPLEKGRKLHKYSIWNDQFFQKIGIIHWRGGWRKYVYQLLPDVDVSVGCGKEIHKFINKLMAERKK